MAWRSPWSRSAGGRPLGRAALVAATATGLLARRKIGGISGDVLGAAEQVAECAVLVVLVGLSMRHPSGGPD
jgi:adenosylcobinamide-GDP ribazoletransferase